MSLEHELAAMRARGEIEGAPRDAEAIAEHLQRAQEVLDAARREAVSSGFSALVLLWEGAALQILLAMTNAAGYRLKGAQGHHRVAIEVGRLLLKDDGLFKRLRQLMHDRQAAVYDASPVDVGLVEDYLDDVRELFDLVGDLVARPPRGSP